MNDMTRRHFLKLAGGVGAASVFGILPMARAAGARVVVIGGGFGGATCAKYIRQMDPSIAVTLIEKDPRFITCPFSNLVLGGLRTMDSITQSFDTLSKKYGVTVAQDEVIGIDPAAKRVKLKSGKTLSYDRLVASPGISLTYDAVPGYSTKAAEMMPHAWQAGPQTVLLRKQLEAMKDGGLVLMAAPSNPFRCPPGPYERASMIAHYLKQKKPKSKIIIVDAKDKFSKQGLFEEGWKKLYPGMIEWVPGGQGGTVRAVDAKKMSVETELESYKPAVANIIPPQKAAQIALSAGLADETGWCPVDPKTFESKTHAGVHVIGDSAIAGALPKSGFAANSEAKMCAAAIVTQLGEQPLADVSLVNTCYSIVGPDYGISVAGVYRVSEKGIVEIEGAGGVSPKDASEGFRRDEAKYATGWYQSITEDAWG
jgi:sulfide dehydrogenase [flavocytochrome c] flavoprotein subunit